MNGTTLYEELLNDLNTYSEAEYARFHSRLLGEGDFRVLGVRVPTLRKLAKKYFPYFDEVKTFADEYYEVKFIKLSAAALLPYESFKAEVEDCVALIDNWALCDCFSAKCIKSNREDFLNYIQKFMADGREFYQRYALTTLLQFYVEEQYLGVIFDFVERANTDYYYVHMAAAWLIAEVLVKHYDKGVEFLQNTAIGKKTVNKAIVKACESFRITDDKKNYLRGLKR